MELNFTYITEFEKFMQIMLLAAVLSVPVSVLTQEFKRVTSFKSSWIYIIANAVICCMFAIAFGLTFSKMNISYCMWLGVCLFLGTTGFYKKMKTSNTIFGRYFQRTLDHAQSPKDDNVEKNEIEINEYKNRVSELESEVIVLKEAKSQQSEKYIKQIEILQKQIAELNKSKEETEPESPSVPESPSTQKIKPLKYEVGDKIYFKGGYHYKTPNAESPAGGKRTAGNTVVTVTSSTGKHRIHAHGGDSDVYGWINEDDCEDYKKTTSNLQRFHFPVKYVGISQPFKSSHLGVDFGYSRSHGGPNVPIYSSFAGKVVYARNSGGSAGKMVRVRYDDKVHEATWYANYKHLDTIAVKYGDSVKQGAVIGRMGHTGGNWGNHLHFDLVRCPLGHIYDQSSERKKYSKNPLDYLWLTDDVTVGDVTIKKYKFKKL